MRGSEPVDTHSIIIQSPKAEAMEGATEPCLLGDAAAEGATEDGRKPDITEAATDPCRCRSHNLSFARTSMFSKGAACDSFTQSRVPRTSSSKKNDDAARRLA